MAAAGDLDRRARFERRALDANGDRRGAWAAQFTRAVGVTFLRGGEVIMQRRLQGKQPVVVSVREDPETRTISAAWRLVLLQPNGADGEAFDILASAPAKERGFLDVTAEFDGLGGGA